MCFYAAAKNSPAAGRGTGSHAGALELQASRLPQRHGSPSGGHPPHGGIAGLLEGIRYVRTVGTDTILAHEQRLIRQLGRGLAQMSGVHGFLADDPGAQAGVLSLWAEGQDCETLGMKLGERDIALRSGLHCAPLAHGTAGTLDRGTVRASVSAFNTEQEIRQFLRVLGQVLTRPDA